MPLYSFECDHCEHSDTEFAKMADAVTIGGTKPCPKCGLVMYRRVADLAHTDLKEFHTPIEMYSIGLNTDEEIRAFKSKAGDVDISTDPADPMYGVPVARNRKQKLAALEASGFVERK